MSSTSSEHIPVRVSTIRGSQPLLFDIFLKVAGRFILYCRTGDILDEERISRLKEKKIKQLYIKSGDEIAYRKYLVRNLELSYKNAANQPIQERALIAQGLQQAATENAIENFEDKMNYNVFKDETRQYVDFVLTENEAFQHLLAIKNDPSSVAHHGVNVATLAVSLATQMGIKDKTELQLLATGCMLHDLEHVFTGLNVNRPLSSLTPEESESYRKHSDLGVARIQELKFYDQMVLKIIRYHHEFINGTGFPDQLLERDIPPLVLYAAVADAYDRLISYENIGPKEAMKKLMVDRVGLYPLNLIQGLSVLLKNKKVI